MLYNSTLIAFIAVSTLFRLNLVSCKNMEIIPKVPESSIVLTGFIGKNFQENKPKMFSYHTFCNELDKSYIKR